MILFLDFDGVLHPQYEGQPVPADVAFCHLARFESVMRDFPEVEIVISSTWREEFSIERLRAWFSSDIALRITGTTESTVILTSPRMVKQREWETVAWLTTQSRGNEPWIALDDALWQFGQYSDHVVACKSYVGLDASAESRLRMALENPQAVNEKPDKANGNIV